MAEFCEGCPLAGDAIGEIEDIKMICYARIVAGTLFGQIIGQPKFATALLDEARYPSRPIGSEAKGSALQKINECTGVETVEKKRLFGEPISQKQCPALGDLAIRRGSDEYDYIADQMGLQNR